MSTEEDRGGKCIRKRTKSKKRFWNINRFEGKKELAENEAQDRVEYSGSVDTCLKKKNLF